MLAVVPAALAEGAAPAAAASTPASSAMTVTFDQPGVRPAATASAAASKAADKPSQPTSRASMKTGAGSGGVAKPPAVKRDALAPDLDLAIKDTKALAVDLPGVMKLDGAAVDTLDPSRARKVRWNNEGSQTVWLSATDPNRIQLPFPNPRVVSTTDVEIDKRAGSSNVYVTFATGVTHAVQIWLEPQSGSSASIGLQLVPKRIPAQTIIVTDDTGGLSPHPAAHAAESSDEFLARAQGELQDALTGGVPPGWSMVHLSVPPIALDGVMVSGARRLSGQGEDIYVYEVVNPGAGEQLLDEAQFDGPLVEAVSIYPGPLVSAGQKVSVAVLVRKAAGS
jgi:conjugal transfer pilus assembly protein TraK